MKRSMPPIGTVIEAFATYQRNYHGIFLPGLLTASRSSPRLSVRVTGPRRIDLTDNQLCEASSFVQLKHLPRPIAILQGSKTMKRQFALWYTCRFPLESFL